MIPTSTNVKISLNKSVPNSAEIIAVFVTDKSKSLGSEIAEGEREAAERLIEAGSARGKCCEVTVDLLDGKGKSKRLFVIGLGAPEKINAETIRQAASALARAAKRNRLKKIAAYLPAASKLSPQEVAEAIATGFLLSSFNFEEYKGSVTKKKKEDDKALDGAVELTLVAKANVNDAISRGKIIADGQNFARTIATRPGNDINPPSLARVAQNMAKEVGLKCKVLDEKQMAKLQMGGILGVGSGSKTPPRMIVLEHTPSRVSAKPILFVGKAITFDTGGISIKGADGMQGMVYDKCGAMAVLGLMYTMAKLNLPVAAVGIMSSAENHISDTSYRPGDILTMYNGVTVEVTNTDAEGRLVLGDALAWGIDTYKPRVVVDLATLTGGVVVALGKALSGVMTNDRSLYKEIEKAGEIEGEKMWELPIWDEHRDQMKSDVADILNSSKGGASPLQGGAFLSYFVNWDDAGKIPWAHIDIAGTATCDKELPYYTKGATGWGIRTLLRWAAKA